MYIEEFKIWYEATLNDFISWYEKTTDEIFDAHKICDKDLQDYQVYLESSKYRHPSTVNKKIEALKAYYAFITLKEVNNLYDTPDYIIEEKLMKKVNTVLPSDCK